MWHSTCFLAFLDVSDLVVIDSNSVTCKFSKNNVACLRQQWRHISLSVVLRRRCRSSSSASTKFLSQFSLEPYRPAFLIFGAEHQYGELYRVMQFRICRMSTSCLTELRKKQYAGDTCLPWKTYN